MSDKTRKAFWAVLEATGTGLHWVIARVPVDLKKAWPSWKNRRVRGEINGFAFRTTLFPASQGKGHVVLVNKRMQAGAKAAPGSKVQIWLEPDMAKQVIDVPRELADALKQD